MVSVKQRAEELMKTVYKPRCDKGGCNNHSGHEFCSVDEAWDRAVKQAEGEAAEGRQDLICTVEEFERLKKDNREMFTTLTAVENLLTREKPYGGPELTLLLILVQKVKAGVKQ